MKGLKINFKKSLFTTSLIIILTIVTIGIIFASNIFGATSEIDYSIQNDWGSGAIVNVSITNLGTSV
jgi:hypothetical protein